MTVMDEREKVGDNPLDLIASTESIAPFTDKELKEWQMALMEPLLDGGLRGERAVKLNRFISRVLADKKRADSAAALVRDLVEALEGVVRVADRKTVEFDAAHAALLRAKEAGYVG